MVGIANYGFVLALAWVLPARQFSELASINSILLVLITVGNAALPWVVTGAVVRFPPNSPQRRQALTVTIGVSLVCAAAGFLVLLALSLSYAGVSVEIAAGAIVVLAFVVQAGSGYLQGRRLFVTLGILMVVEAVIKVGAGSLLAVFFGATGALIGAAAGIGTVVGGSLWFARRETGRSGLPLRAYPWHQIIGIGGVQAGVSGLAMLDVIVGSILHGASRVMAGYQAMLVFTRVPLFLTGALSAAVFSRLASGPSPDARDRLVNRAASVYRSLVPPLVAIACTAPAAVLLLVLPSEYRSSFHLLIPLALAGAACGWLNLLTTCYQAEGVFGPPMAVMWATIPIAAELEVLVGQSVTELAWTAAAVDSAVALILVITASRRYQTARLPRSAFASASLAALAVVPLELSAKVPVLWCAVAVLAVAGGLVLGQMSHSADLRLDQTGTAAETVRRGWVTPRRPARIARRLLLKTWAVVVTRLRPMAPPPAWRALVALRSVAGSGPVVCVPSAQRALVVAPHPDDETIGCGGTIALMAASGTSVHIVVASRGEASIGEPGSSSAETGERRWQEILAAARHLGAMTPVCFELPDSDLAPAGETLVERLREALATIRPEVIFAPWPLDGHPDHQATSTALATALKGSIWENATEVWAYEVWAALPANRLVDITPVWPQKRAALDQHRCGRKNFDLDAHLALSRWRSIFVMNGSGYAEAFLTLGAAAFCQLIGEVGG